MHNFSCTLLLVLHAQLIKGFGMNKLATGNCCTKKSSCTKDSPRGHFKRPGFVTASSHGSVFRHTVWRHEESQLFFNSWHSIAVTSHLVCWQNFRYQRPFTIFRVEEINFKHSWNDRFISCDAKIRQRRTDKNDPTTFLTEHFGAKQMTNESPRWATNAPVANSQQNDKDKCWQW